MVLMNHIILQETHVRTVHNHEKPFNCSICDYLCSNKV